MCIRDRIAPGSAAVALYELSAALPQGPERRELGRRVFARLYQGTAPTFAAVASRMAFGTARQLDTAAMHARVALVLDMPINSAVHADSLALALVARRELLERWVQRPSIGALPARRLAAKVLEHAAREAVTRAQQGDPFPRELLLGDKLAPCFAALLGDREPLVWRHVAVARGLLATVHPPLREEIELALDPALTPTEWRRAAVSLVACMVGDPTTVSKQCERLLAGDVGHRDPGMAATMIWGLPRVIEAEPDAGEALLEKLTATRRPDVAESAAALLADCWTPNFGTAAAALVRDVLTERARDESPLSGVSGRLLRGLERIVGDDSVGAGVRRALAAFETQGARPAYEAAIEAIASAHRIADALTARDPLELQGMNETLAALDDLDTSALERSRLADLLLLGRRPGDTDATVPEIERLHDRLARWVLDSETRVTNVEWSRDGALANQRRLRALLHLVDLETTRAEADAAVVRARVRRAVQVLLRRLAAGPDGMVHRILCAALARSFDAAVREGVAEPSDFLLLVSRMLDDRHSLEAIAEGSTHPEVTGVMTAYLKFLDAGTESADTTDDSVARRLDDGYERAQALARRVVALSHGIGAGSYRSEALRQVLLRLGRALEHVASARGLSELIDPAGTADPIGDVETSVDALRRLATGAARRLFADDSVLGEIAVITEVASLSTLLGRVVTSGVPANARQLTMAITELVAELPPPLATAIERVLERLQSLPVSAQTAPAIPLEKRRTALPDWLLPRRTIGAFYVVRALGSGGGSSVFVARRIEERNDAHGEAFALKVPQYDPTTARSLSEQEFLQLFREEAGALLSLPQHANLARFVTFDLAAKPKPILVMELIAGAGLDRLIRSRALTTERALLYLDGILGGLEAMHAVGVGHLDIKPSNVILRDGETPVLVDFGLSGRHLRPGCGTLEYCAPEVLGIVPESHTPSPLATDMYAFACMAFELLTAQLLFDAEDEATLATAQVAHDGWPQKLSELAANPVQHRLAIVLAACLRRDPRARPSVKDARRALNACAPELRTASWPLPVGRVPQGLSA